MALSFLVVATIAVALAHSVGGCDDGGGYGGYGRGYGGGGWSDCAQYTTCAACTPVQGCGWCESSNGSGLCAGDPNACGGAQQFSWTWDPSGCRVTADASVVTSGSDAGHVEPSGGDAGPAADSASGDAGGEDAGPGDAGDAAAADAGTGH
jgi:hypothetical protein